MTGCLLKTVGGGGGGREAEESSSLFLETGGIAREEFLSPIGEEFAPLVGTSSSEGSSKSIVSRLLSFFFVLILISLFTRITSKLLMELLDLSCIPCLLANLTSSQY